jgi:hypothetical protein
MKKLLFILLFSISSYSQIKIDDIGDNWKGKIQAALELIKTHDTVSYNMVIKNCKYITFWVADFSSTQDSSTILVSVKDMKLNSINNLACVLVHESYHLKIFNSKIKLLPSEEESICYHYEYNFLQKLSMVEPWLTKHVLTMDNYYH